jgi:hypothetical protein
MRRMLYILDGVSALLCIGVPEYRLNGASDVLLVLREEGVAEL